METRKCSVCKIDKSFDAYPKDRTKPNGIKYCCKDCNATRHRTYRIDRKPRYRSRNLRLNYGISQEKFDEMLKSQDGKCAICKTSNPGGRYSSFCVDHDHSCCPGQKTCGKCIRGLLCVACNQGLGSFRDSVDNLSEAISYLATYSN